MVTNYAAKQKNTPGFLPATVLIKKLAKTAALAIIFLLCGFNVTGQTNRTWDGSSSDNWGAFRNWTENWMAEWFGVDDNYVPNSTAENAIIPGGEDRYPVYSTGTTTINNLTINNGGELTVTGGTLSCNVLTVNGTLNLTGGTLNASSLTGSGTINWSGGTLNVTGANTFTGTLNSTGNITFNSLTTCGAGTINATAGTVTYNGSSTRIMAGTYYNLTINSAAQLCGNITVTNTLTLGAIVTLADNNLTLNGPLSGASATRYINTNGSGTFTKNAASAAGLALTYPVGSGGYYTPMVVTNISGTGTNSVSVRAISVNMGTNNLAKNWEVKTGLKPVTATAYFSYNTNEIDGNEADYEVWYRSSAGYWSNPAGASVDVANNRVYTTPGATSFEGSYTAGANNPSLTWYSYQSGDWDNWETWTVDPSGTNRVNDAKAVPGSVDQVVILNGDVVTLTTNNKTITYLTINQGGTLNVGTTTGHNFNTIDGKGLFRLATPNLDVPATAGTFFEYGGGTVEYTATGTTTAVFNDYTYNNLIINLGSTTDMVSCVNNLTINGNFTITRGIYRINNNTATNALTQTVHGNVTVGAAGQIHLGTGNVGTARFDAHRFIIKGNFTNNGSAYFTNLTAPNYRNYTNHRVDVVFNNPTADQNAVINGYTRFYRIEIDKGTDQTAVLNIDASAPDLFYLYGYNNGLGAGDLTTVDNHLALGLLAGTVRLGSNINLPSLVEEYTNGDLNYYIDEDACLWIDGATVNQTSHDDDGTSNSFVIYGKLKITNAASTFNVNNQHGLILRRSSSIEVHNGTLNTPCIRTSTADGTHRGSLTINGGLVNISGNITGSDAHASLSMSYPDMSFNMSGGNLIINQATEGGSGGNFSIVLGMDAANCSVTGGTITINQNNCNADITCSVPLWNLVIDGLNQNRSSNIRDYDGGYGSIPVAAQPLTVLNNFTLLNSATFSTTNPTPDANVTIGSNFTINAGTTYNPGTNTTTFNGGKVQTFTNSGTINGNLGSLTITNNGTDVNIAGTNTTLTLDGDLVIDAGTTLRDGGKAINVYGNLTNSGTHYRPASGAGSIRLTGTTAQTITGNGSGVFNNLFIDKSGSSAANQVTLDCNIAIKGNLRLAGSATAASPSYFNIGKNNLFIDSTANIYSGLTGTATTFTNYRMIRTNGLSSDAGVTKQYNSINDVTFPLGVGTNYLPSTIGFTSEPTTYGTINVNPVTTIHPLTKTTNALGCYWITKSAGFSGIVTNSVVHTYKYTEGFVPTTNADANYIPATYRGGSTWTVINNTAKVDNTNNVVTYDNTSGIDGEYTAGAEAAFTGSIAILYSVANGNWNVDGTWSTTRGGTAGNGGVPNSSTIVYICDSLTVTTTANSAQSAKVFIEGGSTLKLGTTNNHTFNIGFGQGTLEISRSGYFPTGDWGAFLTAGGGNVNYFVNTAAITLPAAITNYNNLTLTLNGTTNNDINLPAADLQIYANLIIDKTNGSQTGCMVLTNRNATRSIVVDSSFIVNNGTFAIYNRRVQNIDIKGDLNINTGALFQVTTDLDAVDNQLIIYGNLVNNGTLTLQNGTCRVFTIFKGSQSTSISGTGTNTFYSLEVDKGTSATSVLSVTSTGTFTTAFDPALTLTNGTFRWNNANTLTASRNSAFPVPATACLSVANGTVNVVNTSDNDLVLQGKLEVLGGTMNIGTYNTARNNDIEYTAAGTPTILVTNGTLNVFGQIRRGTGTTQGSLTYMQTGGQVNIHGLMSDNTRAKLEVCNSGNFTMTNGTINILRGSGGSIFGDLYLQPASYNVTGGTIVLGPGTVTSPQSYLIDATCNIHNLEITSTSTAYHAQADIKVNSLNITGTLNIGQYSSLNCNNLDLNISGNFINNGTFTPGTNNTTFTGTQTQTATFNAATNFYNLVIDKSANSVTFDGTIEPSVINNTTINSGTLNTDALNLNAYGNITNNAIHTSGTGSIVLAGSVAQTIYGNDNGVFGNLTINNSVGIVNAEANITINGNIGFINGYLYIADYLLTLGNNAAYTGVPETNKCIITNGTLSDGGVKKIFSGTSATFTFPVGVVGKYTPVYYSLQYTTPGYIIVKPVNTTIASLCYDGQNELQYYFNVTSSGFTGLSNVTHKYSYVETDIIGCTETDATFIGARFINYKWIPLGHDAINTVDHSINIPDSSYIDGEYTCGHMLNFTDKPLYYSRNANPNITTGVNFTDAASWAIGSHDGAVATEAPNGNPMFIAPGHIININADNQKTYSVEVGGELNIGTTSGHNLGVVLGGGRVIIHNSSSDQFVFPGGIFNSFMNTTGSTVEYYGGLATSPASISPTIKIYQNLEFTGPKPKYLASVDLLIKGNLLITGSQVDNSYYNRKLTLYGNWTDQVTGGGFVPGTGSVTFGGSTASQITSDVTSTFYNLVINKTTNNVTLNSPVNVTNVITLTKGNVVTATDKILTLTSTSTNAVSGGSTASFIDGPLRKNITSGSNFTFPVGDQTRLGKLILPVVTSTTSPNYWTVEYISSDPHALAASPVLNSPLTSISNNEYWVVTRPATGTNTANVSLRYDDASYIGITNNATARSYLRVVEFDGSSSWDSRGQSLNTVAKTVSTTTQVTYNNYIFTLGLAGITATLTETSVTSICDNGSALSIPVTLTGEPNWNLAYRVTNDATLAFVDFSASGITTTDYEISLTGTDLESIANTGASTNYTITLLSVTDNTGSTGVCTGETEFTVLLTYKPDITGVFTVGVNESRQFSTTVNGSNTYQWSWVGTSGSQGSPNYTTNPFTTTITGTVGTYQLRVVETTGTCTAEDVQSITVINTPAPSITSLDDTDNNVCVNETAVYSTTQVPEHTYAWTITGGAINSGAGTSSVSVTWGNTAGTGTLKVVESVGAVSGQNQISVSISAMPDTKTLTASTSNCTGNAASVTIAASQLNTTYQLFATDNPLVIVSSDNGNNSDILLSTGTVNTDGDHNYYVLATNQGCELRIPASGNVVVSYSQAPVVNYGTVPEFFRGNTALLPFNITDGTSNNFTINFNETSNLNGFTDNTVTSTAVSGNIEIKVPVEPGNNVDAEIYFTNTTNNCSSQVFNLSKIIRQDYVWNGSVNIDWANSLNWYGSRPDNTHDAYIPNVSVKPVIGATAEVKSIEIAPSSELTITGTNHLDVHGNWINNGNFVANNSSVNFASVDTISGSSDNTFYNLNIDNFVVLNASAGDLYIKGNLSNDGVFNHGNGTVIFNGTANQLIEGNNLTFNNLTIDNANGLHLDNTVTVDGLLSLTNGNITVDNGQQLIFGASATTNGGSVNSYVNGTVSKTGVFAGEFVFPIGNSHWAPIGITPASGFNETTTFTARYNTTEFVAEGSDSLHNTELVRVSGLEYWDLSRQTDPDNDAACYVTLYCNDMLFSEINDPAHLLVAHYNSTHKYWESFDCTPTGFGAAGLAIKSNVPMESFSPFTFGTTEGANPLPVTLISFTAYQQKNSVNLQWVTQTEQQNDYFTLQRSADGINFIDIGTVKGSGNSSVQIEYSFTDNNPLFGANLYRLKQTDYNGAFEYSDIVSVNYNGISFEPVVKIHPNPVNEKAFIYIESLYNNASVQLINASGALLKSFVVVGTQTEIDMSEYVGGVYSLRIVCDGKVIVKKIIKL